MEVSGQLHVPDALSPANLYKHLLLFLSNIAFFFFSARLKEILEKEAIENDVAQPEETQHQQIQTERDRTRKKQEQKEEQKLQRRKENDQGMEASNRVSVLLFMTASVVYWSEFLATDPGATRFSEK
jgi:Flp pilus assembly protein TadB